MEEEQEDHFTALKPSPLLLTNLISFLSDTIYAFLFALSLPFFSLLSMASHSIRRAHDAGINLRSAAARAPIAAAGGGARLLRRLGLGFMGAAYVLVLLLMLLVLAAAFGVGVVRLGVEEPLHVRERLMFDYTDINPNAVLSFSGYGGMKMRNKKIAVPVGRTFCVSVVLLMPEPNHNRGLGMFQMMAELLSKDGNVIARSGQPCMLRFRSLPIRLLRTFLMGIPLLLGITSETQKITVQILKYKEGVPRTEAIRITMIPRAGTCSPPQLYDAEIIINSKLPWKKQLLNSWKWTFYVCASLYVYIMLLILLVCCFRSLIFPMRLAYSRHSEQSFTKEIPKEPELVLGEERDISEALRRWQRRRTKRRAIPLHGISTGTDGSSTSCISMTREDGSSSIVEEYVRDSESVCLGR
ncbi:seipin-1 [Malania oleifera]|uniref:seipin-1 n=1 Tax=Malania oleifera TaxID=397392 RepID=UPI0025AEB9C4|nr:seipin-1 [Malania oleifera]